MNETNHIIDRLRREIAARARVDPAEVKPDADFVLDLGLSSLDLLSVLAYAEKTFSARFPDEMLGELTSLEKVIEAVEAYRVEQEGDTR